jgi:hypothetical protein
MGWRFFNRSCEQFMSVFCVWKVTEAMKGSHFDFGVNEFKFLCQETNNRHSDWRGTYVLVYRLISERLDFKLETCQVSVEKPLTPNMIRYNFSSFDIFDKIFKKNRIKCQISKYLFCDLTNIGKN